MLFDNDLLSITVTIYALDAVNLIPYTLNFRIILFESIHYFDHLYYESLSGNLMDCEKYHFFGLYVFFHFLQIQKPLYCMSMIQLSLVFFLFFEHSSFITFEALF